MAIQIEINGVNIGVERKKIKNLHLRVYPPDGRVHISAPAWMKIADIRAFAASRIDWILAQQAKIRAQIKPSADSDGCDVWGRRLALHVIETPGAPSIRLEDSRLILNVRPGASPAHRQALLKSWYRQQVYLAAQPLIAQWEARMGVQVARLYVQHMKTRWGTCNPGRGSIRLNAELARRSPACFEYVIVHEMTHLLEASHNARFRALMQGFLPNWRELRAELNKIVPASWME